MSSFVVLLRGVNVGKGPRVPMAEFRTLLSGLGYASVTTVLNSGNAVFRATRGTSAQHTVRVAAALVEQLGVDVPVIVKSAAEFAAIVDDNPIPVPADAHSRFLVAFVQEPSALTALAGIQPLALPPDRFVVGSKAAYLYCTGGLLESRAAQALLGKAGKTATTRNWGTTLKLLALTRTDEGSAPH